MVVKKSSSKPNRALKSSGGTPAAAQKKRTKINSKGGSSLQPLKATLKETDKGKKDERERRGDKKVVSQKTTSIQSTSTSSSKSTKKKTSTAKEGQSQKTIASNAQTNKKQKAAPTAPVAEKSSKTKQASVRGEKRTASSDVVNSNAKRKKTYEHAYEDPDWQGNEDDSGSVASGVMDEDFCWECGVSTLNNEDDWDNVVLCDRCDAEYHLRCAGLDRVPRRSFICKRCVQEENAFKDLSFNIGDQFKAGYHLFF